PFASRLNFAAQQTRALNLVWALQEADRLEGKSIAVIGAGFAGLTAAAGLIRLNRLVDVYERAAELFPLQRRTATRFVHPTINYWPEVDLNPSADMPVLNWRADICNQVIETAEHQWNAEFQARSPVKTETEVTDLRYEAPSGRRVRLALGHGG